MFKDVASKIAWDTEADSFISATVRGDRSVDTNNVPVDVDQWSAAVAGIDRSVCLQEVLICNRTVFRQCEIASAGGTDNSHRDRLTQAERAAHSQNEAADAKSITVAPLAGGGRKVINLDNGDICFRVAINSPSLNVSCRRGSSTQWHLVQHRGSRDYS